MAKKAYIVQYTVTTRIIVDAPDGVTPDNNGKLFEKCSDEAYERINHFGIDTYINAENAEITEDTECPYDEESSLDANCRNTVCFE